MGWAGGRGDGLIEHPEEACSTEAAIARMVTRATAKFRLVVLKAASGVVVDHEALIAPGHAGGDRYLGVVALRPRLMQYTRNPLQCICDWRCIAPANDRASAAILARWCLRHTCWPCTGCVGA